MARLPVVELFGPTLQGEGSVIGRKTLFLRLAGCDYRCLWCDSAFTWRGDVREHAEPLTPEQILSRLQALDAHCRELTITGGNPALYDCGPLVRLLGDAGYRRHVETQGSVPAPWLALVDSVAISPKPPSSGMATDWERLRQTVSLARSPELKVVVFDRVDYEYARLVHERFPDLPLTLQVGNLPQRDDAAALLQRLRQISAWVLDDQGMQGVRVLPQLHVLLWGNRRGV